MTHQKHLNEIVVMLALVITRIEAKIYPAIVHGGAALVENGWPPIVALMKHEKHSINGFRCAGVLVAPQFIISAAHCFGHCLKNDGGIKDDCMDAIPGVYKLGSIRPKHKWYTLTEVTLHPNFTNTSDFYAYDIAIAKLDKPVEDFTATFATLPLNMQMDKISTATIYGWGKMLFNPVVSRLRFGEVQIKPCERSQFSVPPTERNICTLGKRGEGLCQGDSGGPLMCHLPNGKEIFCGIASGSGEKCKGDLQSIFVAIDSFMEWITSHIRKSIMASITEFEHSKVSPWPKYELIKWDETNTSNVEPICNVIEVGSKTEASCSFPFIFNGRTYNACTSDSDQDGLLWCSTLTNNETNEHVKGAGFWGYCTDGCPFHKTAFIKSIKMHTSHLNCIKEENYKPHFARIKDASSRNICTTNESALVGTSILWEFGSIGGCKSMDLSFETELFFQIENPNQDLECLFGIDIEADDGSRYCALLEKSYYNDREYVLLHKGYHYNKVLVECLNA